MSTSTFDRFTQRARSALMYAEQEARRHSSDVVNTEHLLLGLLQEQEGVAARTLTSMGVRLAMARAAVEFIIRRGEVEGESGERIGPSDEAKTVLELAVDESRQLEHDHVGTHHLLLGLIRENEGIAAGVLESLGVNLDETRAQVLRTLAEPREPE